MSEISLGENTFQGNILFSHPFLDCYNTSRFLNVVPIYIRGRKLHDFNGLFEYEYKTHILSCCCHKFVYMDANVLNKGKQKEDSWLHIIPLKIGLILSMTLLKNVHLALSNSEYFNSTFNLFFVFLYHIIHHWYFKNFNSPTTEKVRSRSYIVEYTWIFK